MPQNLQRFWGIFIVWILKYLFMMHVDSLHHGKKEMIPWKEYVIIEKVGVGNYHNAKEKIKGRKKEIQMGVFDEKLWKVMEEKARAEDEQRPNDRKIANAYIEGVREVCKYGINRSKTIRDTFPLYTLHDEEHIKNVIRIMENLLGDHIDKLTRDETAMLILAACHHDIGMSYSEKEREEALNDQERISQYLDANQREYVKAYSHDSDSPKLSDGSDLNYLRAIHHERVAEILNNYEWPKVLYGNLNCKSLISVCQSHGCDIECLNHLEPTKTIDLRFCAILLRLADILDFDSSRAPQAIYEYNGFLNTNNDVEKYSELKWDIHLASGGFDFSHVEDRSIPYELEYNAKCESMQIEQNIHEYLSWVDIELSGCRKQLERYAGVHRELVLPQKIDRQIVPVGYMSGEYTLTLDQGKVMELLVGKNLYHDPAVFVRELLQNAIDAVRTREKLDRNLSRSWQPRINISSWMDDEGYHWFRIEDNGIGMTNDILKNFFLKVGRSFYNSDQFMKMKLGCKDEDTMAYTPISRFGIGILSCFMGDEKTNQVEISTKHFGDASPAIRMQMNSLNGYYYLTNKTICNNPGEMRGRNAKEKKPYLDQPGTAIAVRTNLYQTGTYRGFKEIVDQYVVCPPVPIHYEGDDGSCDYPTEQEFMDVVHAIHPSENLEELGRLEYPLSDEQIEEIRKDIPSIEFEEKPKLILKCVPLDKYTKSPYLSGAMLLAQSEGTAKDFELKIADRHIKTELEISAGINRNENYLELRISLEFPGSFQNDMEMAERKMYEIHDKKQEAFHLLYAKYEEEPLKRDIIEAILDDAIGEPKWKEYIEKKYSDISGDEVDALIIQLVKEYYDIGLESSFDQDVMKCYHAYREMRTNWTFTMCQLNDNEWYRNYFQPIVKGTGERSIAAHNGIYCGRVDDFIETWSITNDIGVIGAILLLKDKYRPEMDISRDQIRRLSLETAGDIHLIYKHLKVHGYDLSVSDRMLGDEKKLFIPWRFYVKLFEERPDFVERLRISTNYGDLTIDELDKKVKEGKSVEYCECPRLSEDIGFRGDGLYGYLCAAYLRKQYVLKVEMDRYSYKVYIEEKKCEESNVTMDYFSPTFFLTFCNDTMCLTNKDYYYRLACNVSHPLSQFIISNAKVLRDKVPGIFYEMQRSLAEDDVAQMIPTINNLLERLRQLPNIGIMVPAELRLSEADFV